MPEKILVRATNWVGDVVMATPALAAIRKNFKDAKVSLLIKPPLQDMLAGDPAVDEFIIYDRKGEHAGPAGLARMVRELRKRRFDRAILLQNAFEAALVAFLAKIPVRMGYSTDGRGILLTDSVKVSDETRRKHQAYYYLDMLSALGLKTNGLGMPRLYLTKDDTEYGGSFMKEHGLKKGELLVGINPGAQYGVAKKWHPERFGEVADKLIKSHGAKVILFGSTADVPSAGSVEASMKGDVINMAGKTSIRELMAIIKRLGLFITNDTGPMHISAALGVPTLAVFGSTDPVATGPVGGVSRVVRSPVGCSPCLKRTCPQKSYICMEQVTPGQVYRAAKEMLDG